MQLSPHFTLEEFEYSSTALAKGIDNRIPDRSSILANLKNLCEVVLEPLRQRVNEPVIISSGYRCRELNRAVGGSPTSQHMTGEACDLYLSDPHKLRQWFDILRQGEFDQLIWERSSPRSSHCWIHVSCKRDRSQNRREVIPPIGSLEIL